MRPRAMLGLLPADLGEGEWAQGGGECGQVLPRPQRGEGPGGEGALTPLAQDLHGGARQRRGTGSRPAGSPSPTGARPAPPWTTSA